MKKILVILVLSFFLSENLLADDYIISDNSTSTNDDNTINGNDSLTLNSGITITTSGKIEGIDASGESNTINQLGNISTSGTKAYGVILRGNSNTLDVSGTITTSGVQGYGIFLSSSDSNTITQSGKVKTTNYTSRLYMIHNSESNNITQSGDLESTGIKWSHGYYLDNGDSNAITQTGNITTAGSSARSHAYFFDDASDASGSDNNTIIQKGNITLTENTNKAYYFESSDSNSITQSGNITTSGTNGHGYHFYSNSDNNTITLTGTITVSGTNAKAIKVESGNDNNTLVLSEEPTINGNLDLGGEDFIVSLSCDLKKDLTIEIENKTTMSVTDNLCGNDTYEILDSSKNADADNSETDGYLRILGEDLEIAQNNPKYRSENVLIKLRGLFDAANYINSHASEDKMFKIFHSEQKREGTYKGKMSGVVGQLSPFILGDIRNNIFLGYTRQDGDFDNGEFLGGDNFALGLKSVYENNGFKASFTPMIGLNDLTVTDFDTDTKTSISTNLLSEFAGFNAKLGKEIKTSEYSSLNLSVQSTLGVQRFPEYLAKFSDGDLSVDEAIEQVLGGGFEVRYIEELGKGFIIQPYIGVNINNNLNNSIKITADGENKNVSPAYETTTGYFAGVSFTKKAKDMNFDLDLMYGNEDGLINQIAAISLTKPFGESKTKIPTTKPDKNIKISSAILDKDLIEFGELKTLNEQLKAQNTKLKAENEKLKLLSAKVLTENKASKQLIVELLKENEKIKLEKEIFKNKILENENKELREKIETEVAEDGVNKFTLLLFFTILILFGYGIASFIVSVFNASIKKHN